MSKKETGMKKVNGGVAEAAKMLSGLDLKDQDRIMRELQKKDGKVADAIKQNLISIDDLIYITPAMLRDLIRSIPLNSFALALRAASPNVIQHILKNLTENNRKDLLEIYKGPPKSMNVIERARQDVLAILRAKVEKQEIVLNKKGEKLV
ncbi:MAG: hypothetical protein HQK50_14165 [Oligoflexia bacterium]|nr:hypothetical protein [Oligoflexia bacterium]